MRLRLASLAGVFALWITAPLPAAGLDLNTREILASGDAVPQFGRVGTGIIDVQGIDGRGRVLVTAQLSNGAEGLFWAAFRSFSRVATRACALAKLPRTASAFSANAWFSRVSWSE